MRPQNVFFSHKSSARQRLLGERIHRGIIFRFCLLYKLLFQLIARLPVLSLTSHSPLLRAAKIINALKFPISARYASRLSHGEALRLG
jgi:hypothetical protein